MIQVSLHRPIEADIKRQSLAAQKALTPTVSVPIHEDFNAFLLSSGAHLQQNISGATKMSSILQNHRFGPEDSFAQKNSDGQRSGRAILELKPESATLANQENRQSSTDTPKILGGTNSTPAAQQQTSPATPKGLAPHITDPLVIMVVVTEFDRTAMGLIGSAHKASHHADSENDFCEYGDSKQKAKHSAKNEMVARSEHASLLKREEIETLRDVKDKFLQQLRTQHPHITVPVKHPEGLVAIHMRFDRKEGPDGKGSMRVMFTGSNAEVVRLFAQHRQEFMNLITKEGYAINHSGIQFNGPKIMQM